MSAAMELKRVIEALVFCAPKPIGSEELAAILNAVQAEESPETADGKRPRIRTAQVEEWLADLAAEYEISPHSFRLVCLGGRWQFKTRPEYGPWARAMAGERNRPARLSQAALETLTIVAYRQPVTRAEIEEIRGVSVDGVLQTLIERGLVGPTGRASAPGRPILYGTTQLFLECFGLRSLEELPAAGELRRRGGERAEQLALPLQEEAEPSAGEEALLEEKKSAAGDNRAEEEGTEERPDKEP